MNYNKKKRLVNILKCMAMSFLMQLFIFVACYITSLFGFDLDKILAIVGCFFMGGVCGLLAFGLFYDE